MASGIDDEVTLRANREGFLKFQLRPRRLVDVSKVDMSTDILGVKYASPIVLAPIGGQRSFHDEGEVASARAAKAGDHLQILSTATSLGVEDVTGARGQPIWYQLYATNKWDVAQAMVKRAEKAGCVAVGVTVDRFGGRNQQTLFRLRPTVGYLLPGVPVGPFTPGLFADPHEAQQLAEIGVALLMFGVGLHFSIKDLIDVHRVAVPGAVVQIAIATALGTAAGSWFGWSFRSSLVLGLAISVASTVVLLRALRHRGATDSEPGKVAIGWLIISHLGSASTRAQVRH
jgi:hypothetical protein